MGIKNFSAIVFCSALLALPAFAQNAWMSDGNGGLRGIGNNFGSGWRSDGNGGFRGTGNNFGSGWRSDGNGGLRGTGNNFGSNCRTIGMQLRCN